MSMHISRWRKLRRLGLALLALLGAGVIAAAPGGAQDSAGGGAKPEGFELSFAPGGRDAAGRFMGGTEIRSLVAHGGKLYAGNGYWEDRPGSEGPQGAQILVLDRPDGEWRVDQTFDDRLPGGRFRDLAIGAMREVVFATDGTGKPLLEPVPVLIASTWDLSGAIRVFARDDATGAWAAVTLTSDRRIPGHLPQVRAFGQHRDRVTGIDHVFAGQDPRGIFSGSYDPAVTGRIRWSASPEFDLSSISGAEANANGLERPLAASEQFRRVRRAPLCRRRSSRFMSGSTARSRNGGSSTRTPNPASRDRPARTDGGVRTFGARRGAARRR